MRIPSDGKWHMGIMEDFTGARRVACRVIRMQCQHSLSCRERPEYICAYDDDRYRTFCEKHRPVLAKEETA